jgi:hypothetical protein
MSDMNLPAPAVKPKKPEPPMAPSKPSDGERVAQRIAAKQFFLQSLGLDWTPDDDDVRREHLELPEDGSIVRLPVFEPKMKEEPEKEASQGSGFNFVPEDPVEDDLNEEEWQMIKEARKAKMGGGLAKNIGADLPRASAEPTSEFRVSVPQEGPGAP